MDKLDIIIASGIAVLAAAFVYIVWSYIKSLKGSPRELYLLFFTKLTEYSCYGAMNLAFILFLSADVGLNDLEAGTYIGVWSVFLTVTTMFVGSIVDALGIRKTLLIGTIILLVSRFLLPLSTNIFYISLLGFIPMAIGKAMMGPVLSVGIKIFTTTETAALGFGLFYTMMNVGWAIGAYLFDFVRTHLGEHTIVTAPIIGIEFSTYQVIFCLGFVFTLPDLIAVLFMREGVEMTDDRGVVIHPPKETVHKKIIKKMVVATRQATKETVTIFRSVVVQRAFWTYIFMLGILIFVRLTFYHFHYTFPKYGIRVLGEGLKIGSIYGVLNPVLIVFLTPLIAALTKKFASYKVMLWGTIISSLAIFIAALPEDFYQPLMNTWFSELIFDRWLDIPLASQRPLFFALIIMVATFTIGEAIWSPRLMQFTAEIAPKGREGSYIALSYLPYFAAKLIVGPLSGWLVGTYTPKGQESYPNHYWVWIWMGGIAVLSPLGLIVFRRLFALRLQHD